MFSKIVLLASLTTTLAASDTCIPRTNQQPQSCPTRAVLLATGDTCSKLAAHNGLSIEQLTKLNPSLNCNNPEAVLKFSPGAKLCLDAAFSCPSGSSLLYAMSSTSFYYPLSGASSLAGISSAVNASSVLSFNSGWPVCTAPSSGGLIVPNCQGTWSPSTTCNAACGTAGTHTESFVASVQGEGCPLLSTRTVSCPIVPCSCKKAAKPLLACTMKNNNNNVLSCLMSFKPVYGAHFTLTTTQADLKLDVCNLIFTDENWNTPQSVTMNPIYKGLPGYMTSTNISIDYAIYAPGEFFNKCLGSVKLTRTEDTLQNMGRCTLTGDPHVGIFSENGYKPDLEKGESMNVPIHGLGIFYAVKSNLGLTIQLQYGRCMRVTTELFQPTCIIGAYIQYHQEYISIDLADNINSKVSVKGSSATLASLKLVTQGTVNTFSVKDSPYGDWGSTITLSDSSHNVTFKWQNNSVSVYKTNYFAAVINLSPLHYQQTQGHCNVYDFSPEVLSPEGHVLFNGDDITTVPFLDTSMNSIMTYPWTKSFEVDSNEVGFGTDGPIQFGRFGSCAAANIGKRSIQKRSPTVEFDVMTGSFSDASSINAMDTNVTMESAMQQCLACFALNNPVLESMTTDALSSCANDIVMAGTNIFCTAHAMIASTHLLAQANAAGNTTDGTMSAVQIALNNFATALEATDCGNGIKVNGVCHCGAGSAGMDCSSVIVASIHIQAAQLQASTASFAGRSSQVGYSLLFAMMMAFFIL